MPVEKNKVVSIDYTLTNDAGDVLDTSEGRGPLTYLHGNGNLIPGMERGIEGKNAGESAKLTIPPGEGYGERDEKMVQAVPRKAFPAGADIKPGTQFQGRTPEGARVVTVVGVQGDDVMIDANHPLAGQTLHFDVTVTGVRDATAEEIEHGHVHGEGGHPH